MEDVIYILIGLAWFGYSAYKANQKKAQKNAALQAGPQSIANQDNDEDEADAPIDTSELIERLFSGTSNPRPAASPNKPSGMYGDLNSPFPQADEKIPVSMIEYLKPEYESIEYESPPPVKQKPTTVDSVVKEGGPIGEEIISFNLRQAVIHQAILNRPYS